MSAATSNFAQLQALAHEPSSTKRRELLRSVTDLFFADSNERTEEETQLFDDILGTVATNLELEVRAELAERLSTTHNTPRRIAKRFAMDEVQVASPILMKASSLTDEDLVEVIEQKGQGHMMAVTKREAVSEIVSKALVDHGNDSVVASLLQNDQADLSRESYEKVTDRAKTSETLQGPLIERKSVPLDLLNEMYIEVEENLREKILERNESVPEEELEKALQSGRIRVAQSVGALPKDFQTAKIWLEAEVKAHTLRPADLVALLRDQKTTKFLMAFAHFTGVDYQTALRVLEKQDIDALAMLSRASKFDRALFVTLAVFVGGRTDNSIKAASDFGEMYDKIPVLAAQRAVRFWKVRHTQERNVV